MSSGNAWLPRAQSQEEHNLHVLLAKVLREEFWSLAVHLREEVRSEVAANCGSFKTEPVLYRPKGKQAYKSESRPYTPHKAIHAKGQAYGLLDLGYNSLGDRPQTSPGRVNSLQVGPRGAAAAIVIDTGVPPALPPIPGALSDEFPASQDSPPVVVKKRPRRPAVEDNYMADVENSGFTTDTDSNVYRENGAQPTTIEFQSPSKQDVISLPEAEQQDPPSKEAISTESGGDQQGTRSGARFRKKSENQVRGNGSIYASPSSKGHTGRGDGVVSTLSSLDSSAFHSHKKRTGSRPFEVVKKGGKSMRSGGIHEKDLVRPSITDALGHFQEPEHQSCTDRLKAAVGSPTFDYCACILLVGNAAFMGVQVDAQIRYRASTMPISFRVVELFFCVAFTVELFLRLCCHGYRYYIMPGWGWSIFDTVLVGMQLFEEVFAAIVNTDAHADKSGTNNIRVIRVLRIVRMLRVVRILRLVRFVQDLRKVIYLIIASFWSFIWTGVLLGMLIYIIGIFITQVVADTWFDDPELAAEGMPLHDYFGTCGDSILSLYMAITGGTDWEVMSNPLKDDISPFMGIVFSMYVMFATLVLLNLVTGVFVDGAFTLSREDHQAEIHRGVRKAFAHCDSDGGGTITVDEWEHVRHTREIEDLLELIEVNRYQARSLFRMLDADEDGAVTVDEFARGALNLQMPIKSIDYLMHSERLRDAVEDIRESLFQVQSHMGFDADALAKRANSYPTHKHPH